MNQDILALAFEGHPIRTTNETPKRISVIDVLAAVGYAKPRDAWAGVKDKHPEFVHSTGQTNFGPGRPTPVIDREGALRLVMILEGPKAAAFREWASSILVRYLDGDRTLAQEIHLRADLEEESEEFSRAEPSEIFEEAAPAVMLALAEKASRGSIQAARLLLQYHATIKGPATTAEKMLPAAAPTLTPLQQFWKECLVSGIVPPGFPVGGAVPVSALIRAFAQWANIPVTRAVEASFGIQLRQIVPAVRRKSSTQGGERRWYYVLPSLAECRRLFASATGMEVQP